MGMDTVEVTELDALLGLTPKSPLTPEQEIDAIADALIAKRAALEKIKAEVEALEDAIVVRTPEEPGDAILNGDKNTITVSRTELWQWDSDVIETKIPTVPVPDFVKVKYSVDKKKIQLEADAVQKDFFQALTRKPGSPRIKINK